MNAWAAFDEVPNTALADFAMEKNDKSYPMKPQKILWDVREALGPDDILLSDVGAHKMWISRYYQCYTANTCLISNGFCSMGFALPGAIGAAIACPDSNVLAINGDAGFMMNVQDLETAVHRSAIFAADQKQLAEAKAFIAEQQNGGRFSGLAIATTVETAGPFFEAEARHQDYHAKHGGSCSIGSGE